MARLRTEFGVLLKIICVLQFLIFVIDLDSFQKFTLNFDIYGILPHNFSEDINLPFLTLKIIKSY